MLRSDGENNKNVNLLLDKILSITGREYMEDSKTACKYSVVFCFALFLAFFASRWLGYKNVLNIFTTQFPQIKDWSEIKRYEIQFVSCTTVPFCPSIFRLHFLTEVTRRHCWFVQIKQLPNKNNGQVGGMKAIC